MAPSTSLLKKLKIKPVPKLKLEDPVEIQESVVFGTSNVSVVPEPTPEERERWAKARALQRTDERGQPVEGWVARINAMKADGRLYPLNGVWHLRN